MKEEDTPGERYIKEVGIGRLIVGIFPFLIALILMFFSLLTLWQTILYVLFEREFNVVQFILNDSVIADPELPLLLMCILFSCACVGTYRDIKKKPFAVLSDEKVVLCFNRKSFSWSQIQAVCLEGDRKLTVTYEMKGKRRKEMMDLRWFPKKDDFLNKLHSMCSARNIPFCERELTLHSRIEMWMGFGL